MNRIATGALALAIACAAASPARAIVGPSEAGGPLERHVVMVLKRDAQGAGFCTAVLLDQKTLLTAAHCVARPQDVRAHYRGAGQPVLIEATDIAIHPGYRADALKTRARSIDLALVRLASPLPASFTPAPLAASGKTAVGAPLRIAGYGVTREGDGESAGRFRSATLVTRAPLGSILVWLHAANGAKQGACTGDSGGPIFNGEDEVFAITVWSTGQQGKGCGGITQGALVAPQLGWIEKIRAGWR